VKLIRYATRYAVIAGAIVTTTACVTTVTPPRSLFEADRPAYAKLFASNRDAEAQGSGTTGGSKSVQPLNPYFGYQAAMARAQGERANAKDQRALLREGMAIVEYRCGLYFDVLGKAIQEISFSRRETSLIGGLVQGSMGLANQSSKAIANTGAIFGFSTGTMDAYQDVYLYTPEIDTIRRLVFGTLVTQSKRIIVTADSYSLDYGQVISLLKQYESVCQPASIRSLVNQAVHDGTISPAPKPASAQDNRIETLRNALEISLDRDAISEDEAFYLYWLQNDKKFKDSDKALLILHLKSIPKIVTDSGLDRTVSKDKVSPYMALLGDDLKKTWDRRIDEARKSAEAKEPKKTTEGKSKSEKSPSTTEAAAESPDDAMTDVLEPDKRTGTSITPPTLDDVRKHH
jgi:hypothetical protein